MPPRTRIRTLLPLLLNASVLAACGTEMDEGAAVAPTTVTATGTAQALSNSAPAREFLPAGGARIPRTAAQISAAAAMGFDYPATLVGTVGKVTVYYDPSLGTPGLTLAQQLLSHAAAPYHDMETIFGITGSNVSVIIAPMSGKNDGSGGARHHGCDFATGGEIYVDATFANTTVDPLSWEIGLYIAELSEAFMGAQNKGWGCGSSNGEGLSRYLAQYEMAPNQMPAWGITGPSWVGAGMPDWVTNTKNSDGDYPSIGAATVYINWMLSRGYSIAQITQAGGATLAANDATLAGDLFPYMGLTQAVNGITITSDNPFGVSAAAGPQRIKGDFNGDGIEDLIVVTSAGSYEYLGKASGGFTANAWVRNDLRLNTVNYTPGDFNGDGRTDLIVTTVLGSFEYLGQAGGGFSASAWTRGDLPLGKVAYVPGDFNGDGKSDLIIVTAGGSYEYTGLAAGGFTGNVWTRTDLTLHNVAYAPGDFNGDGKADLIVVSASGSAEFTGLGAGGFTPNVWTRNDLLLGQVGYAVGDFNGDGKADLIIQNASGSYEYTGLAAGGFTPNVWTRSDLASGLARYTLGDFNGDGKADLMVTTAAGSFEYLGKAAGGFTSPWSRSDLSLSITDYFAGDFNGDGKTDVIILNPSGSYEYTGLAAGGFTANVWTRTDLGLHTVSYF